MDERTIQWENKEFRVYRPETVTDAQGRPVMLQECEELIGGRWEPFITIVRNGKTRQYQETSQSQYTRDAFAKFDAAATGA